MAEKRLNTRIIHKHETEANWNLSSLVPMQGEIIIYDKDTAHPYERIKIGDGSKNVNTLPFVDDALRAELLAQIGEIDALIGDKSVSDQIEQALDGLTLVGESTVGKEYSIDEEIVVAAFGAEIFNNYWDNIATGEYSHAEGYVTIASGEVSHAEGLYTKASGFQSHAEGDSTIASGEGSHAEGRLTLAEGDYSHAEGFSTITSGIATHAEGMETTALGTGSHAEGYSSYQKPFEITENSTIIDIINAWNEGLFTMANGSGAHAEGFSTLALSDGAHSEGIGTVAVGEAQHVQGKYNIADLDSEGNPLNTYAHIIGNGTVDTASNAHTVDWDGNAWFAGDIRVGGTSYANAISILPKMTTITLLAASWVGSTNPWSQVVTVNGATVNSKIDLQPTATQIVELQDNEITLMLQNDNGVVTAWAIGNKPTKDYEMQVLITEVVRV